MASYPQHGATLPTSLGGQSNGELDDYLLVKPGFPGRPLGRLHTLASRAWRAMAAAVLEAHGETLTITSTPDGYRSYEVQVATFRNRYTTTVLPGRPTKWWNGVRWYQKPGTAMAATPGNSNHGWGIAADACWYRGTAVVSITSNMAAFNWLLLNAFRFGFAWESNAEPWHIRYWAGDDVPQAVLDFEAPEPDPTPVPQPPTSGVFTVQGYRMVVAEGTTGKMAKLCQQQINLLAAQGVTEDGQFGPQSVAALQNVQAVLGVSADGQCGPVTWQAFEDGIKHQAETGGWS
jgi:peptidoglycan hydrolase-like protein with peptidoglycan-binding domain